MKEERACWFKELLPNAFCSHGTRPGLFCNLLGLQYMIEFQRTCPSWNDRRTQNPSMGSHTDREYAAVIVRERPDVTASREIFVGVWPANFDARFVRYPNGYYKRQKSSHNYGFVFNGLTLNTKSTQSSALERSAPERAVSIVSPDRAVLRLSFVTPVYNDNFRRGRRTEKRFRRGKWRRERDWRRTVSTLSH